MSALIAFAVSFLWSWIAPKTGVGRWAVDDPTGDDLKVHSSPVPSIGGIGIGLALAPVLVVSGDWWFVASAALALVLGVTDDRVSLPPRIRLAVEIVVGLMLAVSAAGGEVVRGAVIVVAVVVLINAINLFDGLDGLAASATAMAAAGIFVISRSDVTLALVAALLGFLVWNWHPAKLFLGDGGAYLVAVLIVYSAFIGTTLISAISAVALAGVVLVDLAVTVLRRMRSKRPLLEGDRSHTYDQLSDRGVSPRTIAAIAVSIQAVLVLVLILARTQSDALGLVSISVAGLVLVLIAFRVGLVESINQQ